MTSFTFRLASVLTLLCLVAGTSRAQDLGTCESAKKNSWEQVKKDHIRLIGLVEIKCGDEAFFADLVELRHDLNQLVATGNVVFTSGGNRIAADRAEFNTKTRTGTFFRAWGTASLGPPPEEGSEHRSQFGTKEADVYFYGETVEKLGPKKYRVTKGGFTTCVQPEPRWQLSSSSVTVNLDEYAILKNSLFKVKGVPVLYLPLFYYPVQEDDRATGFLLPSYGSSTIRGQSLSNAFFWAINRSQDATFMHDWFGRTGQGFGSEYRYTRGRGSDGFIRSYVLREGGAEYDQDDGSTTSTPERRSYEVQGTLSQRLGPYFRARGRADYFSDIEVQQTYNQNIYEASRRHRIFSGSVTGALRGYSVVTSFDHRETFYGTSSSTLRGSAPAVDVRRSERPLFGSPVYFGLTGNYNRLIVHRKTETQDIDQSLTRMDVLPRVRVPFTRWPFLTINSSFAFRSTYWTESLTDGVQVPDGITRNYYEAEAQITGPVFNRIWTFPGNRYAEKLKHSIEPFFSIERVSAFDRRDQIVQIDSIDTIFGGTTSLEYGIANRFYRKPAGGGTSREILNASVRQTYYTTAEASKFDPRYRSSFSDVESSNFSPLAITVTAWPAERVTANFRAEFDTKLKGFLSMGADTTFEWSDWLRTTADWSQSRFLTVSGTITELTTSSHFLNAATQIRLKQNRFGGTHTFNFDLEASSFLQQRVMVYYNAQCCGFAVEYQHYDMEGLSYAPVTGDRRFNVSVTLAGIGGFGNFFGALGGGGGLSRPYD